LGIKVVSSIINDYSNQSVSITLSLNRNEKVKKIHKTIVLNFMLEVISIPYIWIWFTFHCCWIFLVNPPSKYHPSVVSESMVVPKLQMCLVMKN